MSVLSKELRNQLARTVLEAREASEKGARKALHELGVDEADAPVHLSPDRRAHRRALRAQARQLGDQEDASKKGRYQINHLVEKIAYDQWHRLLFARFLAENNLLISPDHGVGVTIEDCRELAPELGLRDAWEVAAQFAARMLPQIFRSDDPAGQIELAPEDRTTLQQLVLGLPRDVFLADDSLGWVYQFWQAKRKDEVNRSEKKIGADELAPVTQLFTEDYMVLFLLHNTLGAWWTAKRRAEGKNEKLPNLEFTYLRFLEDGSPAAGSFEGWPRTARELRVLDPCMGSGHFLVFALPILTNFRMDEEALSQSEACEAVLRDNLFGLEVDPRCTQIAAFNLALAAWKLGGYRTLPPLNLACCGLGINATEKDWLKLAGHDDRLRDGMERLYRLFQQAPVLGSLINPHALDRDLYTADFHELQPLLGRALASEETSRDEDALEMGITAQGLAHAAEILINQFHLIATNVPYLGRGKQDEVLKDHCEVHHAEAKADLATCFIERCLSLSESGGTAALVSPQNWLFLASYKRFRQHLLKEVQLSLVVRLGEHGFDSTQAAGAFTAMIVLTRRRPDDSFKITGIDASVGKIPEEKEIALRTLSTIQVSQRQQLDNPDARVSFSDKRHEQRLSEYCSSFLGLGTGDYSHYGRCFWEFPCSHPGWAFQQGTVETPQLWGGREHVIAWDSDIGRVRGMSLEEREQIHNQDQSGQQAWGKKGVAIGLMRNLKPTIYTGEVYGKALAVLLPNSETILPALWVLCSNSEFNAAVRQLDHNIIVANGTLVKIPFDLDFWQRQAEDIYPYGLPEPHSNDPTQWLFNGQPNGSEQPLHVAVARLLGYRWPRQTGSSFPDCPALGPDGLEPFADDDGIVCVSPVKTEQPAAERLRALLAAAFGHEWSAQKQAELLDEVGYSGKSFEDWLRNGFFEQHCQIFHQRPFIWQIWDGRNYGFSALVNYHRLDRATLEKLTYTYLGDWIFRQRNAVEAEEEGSDAKLAAALELKAKLEKILEGEEPYNVFIRWKPIEKQPIGWEPDLNDGVRLNIRPFVEAGVLRRNPKINWNKDRGKDVPSAPWYKVFKGERINDHHLTLSEKRAARASE
jgi:hypothetical protein